MAQACMVLKHTLHFLIIYQETVNGFYNTASTQVSGNRNWEHKLLGQASSSGNTSFWEIVQQARFWEHNLGTIKQFITPKCDVFYNAKSLSYYLTHFQFQ